MVPWSWWSSARLGIVLPLPYVVLSPGPVIDVLGKHTAGKPLITITGAPTFPTPAAST